MNAANVAALVEHLKDAAMLSESRVVIQREAEMLAKFLAGRGWRLASVPGEPYTAGELVEVANIIDDVASYASVEDCARAVIPAVQRLLSESSVRRPLR